LIAGRLNALLYASTKKGIAMAVTRVIHISDAELAASIRNSAEANEPLRVEAEGATFVLRVAREGLSTDADIWADYDPEKVREALDRYAGAWADLDAEELKAKLYRAREEGSRPAERP
jgi:hypothetical protein